MTSPGWYHADGDAAETIRYWNGTEWVGGPTPRPPSVDELPSPTAGPSLATAGRRMAGRIIDFMIGTVIFGVFIVSGVGGSAPTNDGGYGLTVGSERLDTQLEFFVLGVFLVAGHVFMIHRFGGTPGKLMLKMRIADLGTGNWPPTLQQSLLRSMNYLIFFVVAISISLNEAMSALGLLIGLVSFILLVSAGRRTVMDRLAGTIVIELNRSA